MLVLMQAEIDLGLFSAVNRGSNVSPLRGQKTRLNEVE